MNDGRAIPTRVQIAPMGFPQMGPGVVNDQLCCYHPRAEYIAQSVAGGTQVAMVSRCPDCATQAVRFEHA